jgi:putative sterol carrier protein
MVKKAEDPKQQARFKRYTRTLLMRFSDLGIEFAIDFNDGKASVTEGGLEKPDMTVTSDSQTIIGILNGELSAMRAFMSGRIKADGAARDLMKLQHLLKK